MLFIKHPEKIDKKYIFSDNNGSELENTLTEIISKNKAISICAPQIGIDEKVFALDGGFIFFNPKLVAISDEIVLLEETDIAYPGFSVKINRPKNIRVRYQRADGESFTHPFTGMTARYVQHCIDILDGINWINRANLYHKQKAFKHWKK